MKNFTIIILLASLFFTGNQETTRTITGVVYLEDEGEAIGADVFIEGKELEGTTTDFDGTFSLDVSDDVKELVFSYTGFADKTESIEGKDHIEVTLESDANLMQEVVVGYSVERKYLRGSSPSYEEIEEVEDKTFMWSDDVKGKKNKTTWKRSGKIANTATLFVGDEEQLPLKGTQISVTVDGFRARVLVDCFFYNDEKVQREGTFKMKLPQGAVPYYFAFGESVYERKNNNLGRLPFVDYQQLDFSPNGIERMRSSAWTNPREARVVEKEKAAFAYSGEVRQKVDPALAEWGGADIYNCRVFPLLPKQLHRIVIAYDMNLNQLDEDWLLNFGIPDVKCPKILDFEIAEFANVNSQILPAQKEVEIENNYKKFRLVNPKEKEISIRYPKLGNMTISGTDEGENKYFATAITPELPEESINDINKKGIIALDISLSASPDKFNIWLKLIEELLNNNRDAIKEFNVLLFNVESFWWKPNVVINSPKNVKEFLKFANTLSLEGASDLGLAFSEITKKEKDTNIFLLSDGAATWGLSDNYELSNLLTPNQTVFAYNTGLSGTSNGTLQHLAAESGGAVFSIIGEDELNRASKAFRKKPWRIKSLKINNTEDILVAGRLQYIYAGQKLMLAGRFKNKLSSTIYLIVEQNGIKKEINIPIKRKINSELASRTYGQMATEQLESFNSATEKYAISYAKHFKVPGQTCSMLMLETENDYKEYNIKATEDEFVVNSTKVNFLIQEILNKIGESLGDAKAEFQNWLNKLTEMPDMTFTKTTAIDLICNQLSASDFSVQPKGLNCISRIKKEVDEAIKKELLKDKLSYSIISDAAEKRKKKYGTNDALKLLSSLIEKNPGDGVLARDVAYSALEWNLNEQAYFLLKRVMEARPYEPQTYHAIAQALAKSDKKELALLYYEIAVTAKWNDRFGEFNKIVGLDYIHFLNDLKNDDSFKLKDFAEAKIKTMESLFNEKEADILIAISWNTDNTDVDLHIKEPTGEVCSYKNKETKIGGKITNDVTQGYGPEMYILKSAKKGKYLASVHYYSTDTNRTSTRTKVYATIYKNWGRENEEIIKKVVPLKTGKDMHDILEIDL